jgi:hypothetical protein
MHCESTLTFYYLIAAIHSVTKKYTQFDMSLFQLKKELRLKTERP